MLKYNYYTTSSMRGITVDGDDNDEKHFSLHRQKLQVNKSALVLFRQRRNDDDWFAALHHH